MDSVRADCAAAVRASRSGDAEKTRGSGSDGGIIGMIYNWYDVSILR